MVSGQFGRDPDRRLHLCLCFPLSISFLCTFLSSLESALIYHRFPLQSRLERRSVLKRICAIPGPSRTVGFTSVYAFLLVSVSPAKTSTNAKPDKARKQEQHQGKQGSERKGQREKANKKAAKTSTNLTVGFTSGAQRGGRAEAHTGASLVVVHDDTAAVHKCNTNGSLQCFPRPCLV